MANRFSLPKARKNGKSNGLVVVSYRWLMLIIAMAAVSLFKIQSTLAFTFTEHNFGSRKDYEIYRSSLKTKATPTSLMASTSWSVPSLLGREDAQKLLEGPKFLPAMDYGDRIVFGRQAAEKEYGENEPLGVMMSDDPRLARTYAEFPLDSLDLLLDRACSYLPEDAANSEEPLTMVDIGSGLGRIVLYSALTRGSKRAHWQIRGIEISESLHNEALKLAQTGIDMNLFGENEYKKDSDGNSFLFHCGSATDETGKALLEDAHLVFAYSTAFKAKGSSFLMCSCPV